MCAFSLWAAAAPDASEAPVRVGAERTHLLMDTFASITPAVVHARAARAKNPPDPRLGLAQ